ncbi:MAG: hypothetical protein QG597_546 [Actinomycetota bacterium]|nr:hypothetical protein [Actinomycetota bacterium]
MAKDESSGVTAETPEGADLPTEVLWRDEPAKHDYPAAGNYLGLIADDDTVKFLVDALEKAPVVHYRANDLLRAARLDLLPLDDTSVKTDLRKIILGTPLSPVLIVRGDVLHDYPLTIADGYHRTCASYHLSEKTYIPCKVVDLPVKEKP